jgi:hypothetical protein
MESANAERGGNESGRVVGLSTFPWTLRRTLDWMAGLCGLLILRVLLDAMTRHIRVATRSLLLMRRVSMIFGLEMLGLVLGTFAIPGHHFSNVESDLDRNIASIV